MLQVTKGKVTRIIEEQAGLQTLEVMLLTDYDGGTAGHTPTTHTKPHRAIHYTTGNNLCKVGDLVLLNITAVQLGLGTGGHHFVVARLTDQPDMVDAYPTEWGHIIKMRYTPWQMAVDAAEEQNSPWHDVFCDGQLTLEHTPVIIGELHSLLPIIALRLHRQGRLSYVMPDGASLPIVWSRHVSHLQQAGILSSTVTTGHAWGGDFEAVNLHTGLLAAKHLGKADVILCILGPGVVGTGTPFGFSGMQLAEIVHTVSLLDGLPIVVPRISFADPRERHRGISHHTRTILTRFTLRPAILPIPLFGDERDDYLHRQADKDGFYTQGTQHVPWKRAAPTLEQLVALQAGYPEPITTMGRHLTDDPSLFQAAYVAAEVALCLHDWLTTHPTLTWHTIADVATLAQSWSAPPSHEV